MADCGLTTETPRQTIRQCAWIPGKLQWWSSCMDCNFPYQQPISTTERMQAPKSPRSAFRMRRISHGSTLSSQPGFGPIGLSHKFGSMENISILPGKLVVRVCTMALLIVVQHVLDGEEYLCLELVFLCLSARWRCSFSWCRTVLYALSLVSKLSLLIVPWCCFCFVSCYFLELHITWP